jgi:hypothetical protein
LLSGGPNIGYLRHRSELAHPDADLQEEPCERAKKPQYRYAYGTLD